MSFNGLRAFVVEDEAIIRMMVVEMLEELGHTIAAETGHFDKAMQLASTIDFDIAILDVNLGGKLITPVAKLINDRGLSLIFASGYGTLGLPEEFRDRPALQKPFELKALSAAIVKVRT